MEPVSSRMQSKPQARFVTLLRSEADFISYMNGTFSKTHIAIPVNSYSVNSSRERVTFRIEPFGANGLPSRLKVLLKAGRIHFLTLGLGPLIVVWSYLRHLGVTLDLSYAASACLALLFFHLAVFFLNDYADHLSGKDRTGVRGSQGILQLGWMRPVQLRRWGLVALGLGVLCGLPALRSNPVSLGLLGAFGVAATLTYSWASPELKRFGIGELLRFLCLGPFLTFGYGMAISGEAHGTLLALGVFFGLSANLIFQLRQIEGLYRGAGEYFSTWIGFLGFDRGKKFLLFLVSSMALLILGTLYFYLANTPWAILLLAPIIVLASLFYHLKKARSPLSSDLNQLWYLGCLLHFVLSLAFLGLYWMRI